MTAETALLLNAKSHGENAAILTTFGSENGLKRGLIRGLKKKQSFLQAGNRLLLTHARRLENQLGTFNAEPSKDYATPCLHSAACLASLSYITELLARTLPEEQAMPNLFTLTEAFLDDLTTRGQDGLWQRLAFYELTLLTTMGYGLSLTEDSGAVPCASGTPLMYVSPKTGRAVTQVMGRPYANQLLPLPALFGGPEKDESEDRHNTFALTGFFLNKLLHDKKLNSRTFALQALSL